MTPRNSEASPPVDFTVYGLEPSWQGARWLDFFDGRLGEPTWGVWLGHRADGQGLLVGTLPRERFDEAHLSAADGDGMSEVAATATLTLVNITLPNSSIVSPPGASKALADHALAEAKQYASWPTVSWVVDDRQVSSRIWSFAGAWVAFTADISDSYIVAAGVNRESTEIRLTPVKDGAPYGLDLSAELRLGNRQSPGLPAVNARGFHVDQLTLFSRMGLPAGGDVG